MSASRQEIVDDEARRRPLAGVMAVAAGLLTLGAAILQLAAVEDRPDVQLVGALQERVSATGEPRLKIEQALFFDDKALQLVGVSLVAALAAAAAAFALTMLFRATRSRNPEASRVAIVTVMSGSVMIAVGGVAQYAALLAEASSFADQAASEQTAEGARDVIEAPAYIAGALIDQFGRAMLGLAFILVALNAMRVGLLTRFMGVLGMISGALFIVPLLGGGLPLVQTFWLIAVGALLLGYWPSGIPAAWTSGSSVPWPSQQQVRERKEAARAGRDPEAEPAARPKLEKKPAKPASATPAKQAPATPAKQAPARPAAPAHSASKKRKRKRRG